MSMFTLYTITFDNIQDKIEAIKNLPETTNLIQDNCHFGKGWIIVEMVEEWNEVRALFPKAVVGIRNRKFIPKGGKNGSSR